MGHIVIRYPSFLSVKPLMLCLKTRRTKLCVKPDVYHLYVDRHFMAHHIAEWPNLWFHRGRYQHWITFLLVLTGSESHLNTHWIFSAFMFDFWTSVNSILFLDTADLENNSIRRLYHPSSIDIPVQSSESAHQTRLVIMAILSSEAARQSRLEKKRRYYKW